LWQVRLCDFVDEVQEQRTRAAEQHAQHDEDDDDDDWQAFFARLQELGFELPSEEDDSRTTSPQS